MRSFAPFSLTKEPGMEKAQTKRDIFFSYRWTDKETLLGDNIATDRFLSFIEDYTRLSIFWDQRELRSGDFVTLLRDSIPHAYVFMPLVTKDYCAFGTSGDRKEHQDYCLVEYAIALCSKRKIVPIFIDKDGLSSAGAVPTRVEAEEAARRILERIEQATAGEPITTASNEQEDLAILCKYLCAQNGCTISPSGDFLTQLEKALPSFALNLFDTFCLSEEVSYFKDYLERSKQKLNRIYIPGAEWSTEQIRLDNTYVPISLSRQPTTAEKKTRNYNEYGAIFPINVEDAAFESYLLNDRYAVLIGDAGYGKSTFVKHLVATLSDGVATYGLSRDHLFPLYFECKNLKVDSFADKDRFLGELARIADLGIDALKAILNYAKPLFIFDAMDEIPSANMDLLLRAIHAHLFTSNGDIHLLFTSRPGEKHIAGDADMTIDNERMVVRHYVVEDFNDNQVKEYIDLLSSAQGVGQDTKERFLAAIAKNEREIPDYRLISRNPFLLFSLFGSFREDMGELPRTRFATVARVIDRIINRDRERTGVHRDDPSLEEIRVFLGAIAYQLYVARDDNKVGKVHFEDLARYAPDDDFDTQKCERFLSEHRLVDKNGFGHEFLQATYAAYYLKYLLEKQREEGAFDYEDPDIRSIGRDAEYWRSVKEALLCVLDRTTKKSTTYIEPFLEKLQDVKQPDYEILCRAVSQFENHQPRAAKLLLSTMLERGCAGIRNGHYKGELFLCDPVNPYDELFYWPSIFPFLQGPLQELTAELYGTEDPEYRYLKDELLGEVQDLLGKEPEQALSERYTTRDTFKEYQDINQKMIALSGLNKAREGGYLRFFTEIAYPDSALIELPTTISSVFFPASGIDTIFFYAHVFQLANKIYTLVVHKDNPLYHSNHNCIIETKRKVLLIGCKNSTIPSDGSVAIIGNNAFANCEGLISINIPNGIKTIERDAFSNCDNLATIKIPASVTKIAGNVFRLCKKMKSILVAEDNPVYHSDNTGLIETKEKTLIAGFNNTIIPEDGSVTSIGDRAFEKCLGFSNITIPETITQIGRGAFMACSNLKTIQLPPYLKRIESVTFASCTALETVLLPNTISSIGIEAFEDCRQLRSFVIPPSVITIGEMGFLFCINLRSVELSKSTKKLGKTTFKACSLLKTVYYHGTPEDWEGIKAAFPKDVEVVYLPDEEY